MENEQRADGTLSDTPLPDLLSTIAADSVTGVLRVDGGSEIWFNDGRICLASTPSSPDLAKVLYGGDVGTLAEIEEAIAAIEPRSDGSGSVIDKLLVGHPDAEPVIARILHEHNLNSLFEMLVPSEASFRFERDIDHPIGARFADDATDLVAEAEQRLEIWRRIAARIPSTAAVFTLARSLPGESDQRLVTADEWRFLSLLDGRNTVADLISATGESAFRVCSSLYRLLLEEMVEESLETATSSN
ncbi:MAG: DUF4388 domain-containing protein [Acidimicrobiales bacterium]